MHKKIYRSHNEKMIAGIAGGLAEYFEIDPLFIRLAFIFLTIFHGAGIILYIACLFIMPTRDGTDFREVNVETETFDVEDDYTQRTQSVKSKHRFDFMTIVGVVLVLMGGLFLADNFIPHFRFHDIFPIILIIVGVLFLINSLHRSERGRS